jgi:hypothetical protein
MEIRTKGIPDNVSRSICKEAIRFYGNELLGSRLAKNIKIFLVFEELPNVVNALCQWNDDNHLCRSFVIILNKKMNKKTTLIALAHEMVHVKQYARGELKDYLRSDKVKWRKRVFRLDKVEYWSSPWEVEAYKKDKILYEKYKQRNK